MVNCITLHQVFKTDANLHHIDMMMHVFHHLLQDIFINVGNLKSDGVFQSLHGKRFIPVYSLLQAAPKKKTGDGGLAVKEATQYDILLPQRSTAMTHAVKTSATQSHLLGLQQITHAQYWHEDLMLLKQVSSASDHSGKNDLGVPYESLYIFIHNKHERFH